MKIKWIETERFQDYKVPSMLIAFPSCTFKCEQEAGVCCCQNSALARAPSIDVPVQQIVDTYTNNKITSAVVMGGLEPLDAWAGLLTLIEEFRKATNDDIVIYTGYQREEKEDCVAKLQQYPNIVVKWGRYTPNGRPRWDDVLGVELASENQYAERISNGSCTEYRQGTCQTS